MMTLVEENKIWMNEHLRLSNIRYKQRLRRQKNRIMEEVNGVLAVLGRRNTLYTDAYIEYINHKIVPYLEKNKFLPDSYLNMLDEFIKRDKKEV